MTVIKKILYTVCVLSLLSLLLSSCAKKQPPPAETTQDKTSISLITLDPGHFHAALVQKTMYEQVSPAVHVYAPPGSDVQDHLNRIDGFNSRAENPTSWKEIVYTGDDFLQKMVQG